MPIITLKPVSLIHYPDGRKGLDVKKTFWLNAAVVQSFKDGIEHWLAAGKKFWVTECLRTIAVQAKLKQRKPGLACQPGWSLHGHGRAVDFDVRSIGGAKELIEFYEHMQRFGWYTIFNFPREKVIYQSREAWHIQNTADSVLGIDVGVRSKTYLTRWANANGGVTQLTKLEYKK